MASERVQRTVQRRGRPHRPVQGRRGRLHRFALLTASAAAVLVTSGLAAGRTSMQAASERPFEHKRHETVSCRQCHGAGARHRVTLVRTARDCAACHHDPGRRLDCVLCHESGGPRTAVTVDVPVTLSVWEAARRRDLPFTHVNHTDIGCRECHGASVTPGMSRECNACHESHHRANANCASCHSMPDRAVHPPEAHLSCAGAGCHAVSPRPALTRSLCLACHPARPTHEPKGDCAGCHRIPGVVP
jgi:hypothetical protein